ncbi:MAG: sulfotransferase [Alphaproteobacteria bacterium]|nr:sulfotransferase [Alphaproteobacteria bacterium]MCW5738948.1 sulfotransferase [Alphaproteobacteria bacterium]
MSRRSGLMRRIGDFETRRLAPELDGVAIRAPIFICGLARSGTTILLETLAAHPDTVTHRYRDYPGVLAPVFWDHVASRLYAGRTEARERAHGDGIAVTPDSPEAIEEMLWMAFHPRSHDPAHDNSLGRGSVAPDFAARYRDHIRKLLWLRRGSRYLSKGNYNTARLEALIDLFPDARFFVPVREPVAHIASLVRQHARFCVAEARHPAALRYMQRIGHFEFGLDRRPLNLGDGAMVAEIQRLWRQGREVEGWSLYWSGVHAFIADRLARDSALRGSVAVVRFEDLCAEPTTTLNHVLAHAGLPASDAWVSEHAARLRAPDYYSISLDAAERQTIRRLTAAVAARFGY